MSDLSIRAFSAPVLASALLLSSCSFGYELEARVEGGRLLFVNVGNRTVCVNNLTVVTDDPTADAAHPGEGMWGSERRVWSIETRRDRRNQCFADLPLRFGEIPKGAVETVEKHRLKFGTIYRVYANGPGSVGQGYFRLRQTITVDNLPPPPDLAASTRRPSAQG